MYPNLLQALIAITSAVAVYLMLLPESDPRRRWACVVGMVGQPGWLLQAWTSAQWGAWVGSVAFTVAYLSDFRRVWWPGIDAWWQGYCAKLRAEHEADRGCFGTADRKHNWHHETDWASGYYSDPEAGYSGDNVDRSGLRCYECGAMRWDQSDEEFERRHRGLVLLPKGTRFDFARDRFVLPDGTQRRSMGESPIETACNAVRDALGTHIETMPTTSRAWDFQPLLDSIKSDYAKHQANREALRARGRQLDDCTPTPVPGDKQ